MCIFPVLGLAAIVNAALTRNKFLFVLIDMILLLFLVVGMLMFMHAFLAPLYELMVSFSGGGV